MGIGNQFNIILADDDPDDRELFTEALAGQSALIISLSNGKELMEILGGSEKLPDFVFLDLNMPEKGGKECLGEIRSDERLKDLPVIIYSTSSTKKDIDDTFELGANLYLTKPNSFSELKRALHRLVHLDWSDYTPKSSREAFIYSAERP